MNIARDEAMIAHTDVAVYVRRRGKQVRTSCLFGMEMLCAYIESIETASHLAMIRREANFARETDEVEMSIADTCSAKSPLFAFGFSEGCRAWAPM